MDFFTLRPNFSHGKFHVSKLPKHQNQIQTDHRLLCRRRRRRRRRNQTHPPGGSPAGPGRLCFRRWLQHDQDTHTGKGIEPITAFQATQEIF